MNSQREIQKFNLLDEPWIDVLDLEGRSKKVSILQLFAEASSLRGLGQELSTQRFAILRVLLAFLHRALAGPEGDVWSDAWVEGFPEKEIQDYAREWRDRFWLIDAEAPFFQTPSLQAPNGPEKSIRKIMADLPDGDRTLFSGRSIDSVELISWQEAALWLVHAQAYDTAGIKTGAKGDPLVKAGKGFGYGLPAWAGQIGGISAIGENLQKTLLLNLTLDAAVDDLPAWEREVPTSFRGKVADYEREVTGPVDLMTWQSRRILIEWDDNGMATGLTLSQGDRITPQSPPLYVHENMTSWRFSEPQTKKYRQNIFMPHQHDPAQQSWRGLSRLLARPATRKNKESVKVPLSGLINWLAELREEMGISFPSYQIENAGYEYGPQNATYAELVDDSWAIPALLIEGNDAENWAQLASEVVREAEDCAYAVRRLAENLDNASGKDDSVRADWQARTLVDLDSPLRMWLAGLTSESSIKEKHREWQETCRKIVESTSKYVFAEIGSTAFLGKSADSSETPMTPGRAQHFFYLMLNSALPLTVLQTRKKEEESK